MKNNQQEIAERKKIKNELMLKEQKFQNLFDNTTDLIHCIDNNGKIIYVNNSWKSTLGFTDEDIRNMYSEDIIHSDDMKCCEKMCNTCFTGKNKDKKEFIFLTKDKRSVICEGNVVCDFEDGKRVSSTGIFRDITINRNIEEKIKKQSAKLNAIFQSSSHQIYSINKEFKLTSFNKNYANEILNTFGIKPEINMDVREMMFDKNETATLIKVWKSAFKGKSQHFENRIIDKKGSCVWYETHLDPIFLSDGSIEELSFITHNITEIKLSEEKIIHSLKEKEILLKEVHHRVKNNLQIISSILNLKVSYVQDEEAISIFRECQNRIMSMAFIHENLYQTKNFSNVIFSEYIRTLSRNLVYSYSGTSNAIELKFEVAAIPLNIDIAIPCGLIVNELLSNSFKHAFPEGRRGEIFIGLYLKKEEVELIIKDDGIGLPKNINYRETISLGLQLVVTLVNQLNGEIKLERKNGTKFSIKFKQ